MQKKNINPAPPACKRRRSPPRQQGGFRQCRAIPGRTKSLIWEFWPAELRRLFLQAGIRKSPAPPAAPECRDADGLPERDAGVPRLLFRSNPALYMPGIARIAALDGLGRSSSLTVIAESVPQGLCLN